MAQATRTFEPSWVFFHAPAPCLAAVPAASPAAILWNPQPASLPCPHANHHHPQVARTRTRPLASGAVTVPQAIAFLGAQLSLGLVILLQLNTFTQILGASSLLLVATYPLVRYLLTRNLQP